MLKSNEIKRVAFSKIKNSKVLSISVIFVIVNIALSTALTFVNNLTINTPILQLGINLIYMALFLPLSFGLISSIVKIINGKNVEYTTIFNDAILSFSKTISIFIRTLLKIILPSLLLIAIIIGILFLTAQNIPLTTENLLAYYLYIILLYSFTIIGIAIFTLPYVLAVYTLANNPNLTAKDCINHSKELMNGKKFEFVKLLFSFLGWILLLALIISIIKMISIEIVSNVILWIGMTLLTPYVIASIYMFFEECNNIAEK